MKKISANISDDQFRKLREIQTIINIEDNCIIAKPWNISEIIGMLIDRGYQATECWKQKPTEDEKIIPFME